MKNNFLFALLSLGGAWTCIAQTNDTIYNDSIPNYMENLIENLDMSHAGSGYLADLGYGNFSLHKYLEIDSGQGLPNNSPISLLSYLKVQNQLNHFQFNPLTPPNNFAQDLIRNHTNDTRDEANHLGMMFMKYHFFHPDENVLLQTITYSNNQCFDKPNRPFSPFDSNYVFMATASNMIVENENKSIKYKLDSDDFTTNINSQNASISIDFDDGVGYQSINLDQEYTINYADFGPKKITAKLSFGGVQYLSSSIMVVKNPLSYGPGLVISNGYDNVADDTIKVEFAGLGAAGFIEYGCGHNKLVNPLIIVEGIDFSNTYFFDDLMDDLGPGEGNVGISSQLENNQFDIVFIDFEDAGASMTINAVLVELIINKVNERKLESIAHTKNIVLGISMGGVLARMALAEMEISDPNGINHDTKEFISYDSPHKGANIPIATQLFIKDLSGELADGTAEEVENQIDDVETLLEDIIETLTGGMLLLEINFDVDLGSDFSLSGDDEIALLNLSKMSTSFAAKQLLLYHHSEFVTQPSGGNYHNGTKLEEHVALMNYLDIIGFPTQCHSTGLSNGNNSGLWVKNLNPLAILFKIKVEKEYEIDWFPDFEFHANIEGLAMGNYTSEKKTIYDSKTFAYYKFIGDTRVADFWHRKRRAKTCYPYDTAPGSVFEVDAIDAASLDATFINEGFTINGTTMFKQRFCFIPIVSALNMSQMNNPEYDFSSIDVTTSPNGTGESTFNTISTFDYLADPSFNNGRHDIIATENVSVMAEVFTPSNIDYPTPAAPYLNQKINFGRGGETVTRNYALPFPILSGGILCVNCDDRIGFSSNQNNNWADNNSHFEVEISEGCDYDGVEMIINNGGLIEIGDAINRTGILLINSGTVVRAKSGSTIRVRKNSKLIVDENAQLIIEDGAIIILEDATSVLEFHGKEALKIEDNATFTFTGSGNLYFDKGWDSNYPQSIIFGTNSKLNLTGSSISDLVLKVGRNFIIGGDNTNEFKIYKGTVEIEQGNTVSVSTPIDWRYARFESSSTINNYHSVTIWGQEHSIRSCEFIRGGDNNSSGAGLEAISMHNPLRVLLSDFIDCKTGIRVQGEQFIVSLADFTNCRVGIDATAMEGLSRIWKTDFIDGILGVYFEGQAGSELLVKTTDFTATNSTDGIHVKNSKLNLECSSLINLYSGIIVEESVLVLNTAGKNEFTNCEEAIFLENAKDLFIKDGYNTFTNNFRDFFGIMHNINGYNTTSFTFIPATGNGQADPDRYELDLSNNATSNTTNSFVVEAQAWHEDGQMDRDIIPINYSQTINVPSCDITNPNWHINELNFSATQILGLQMISSVYYDGENLYDVASDATGYMTYQDVLGQNTTAVTFITDILNNKPSVRNNDDDVVLNFLYQKMLEAVGYAYTEEEILRNPGTPNAAIDATLAKAIAVIDDMLTDLDPAISSESQQMSQLLLDKSQLFRTAGHFDYADIILSQSSNWDDINFLSQANYWSCIVQAEEDLILGNIVLQEFINISDQCEQGINNARMAIGLQASPDIDENVVNKISIGEKSQFQLAPSVSKTTIKLKFLGEYDEIYFEMEISDILGKSIEKSTLKELERSWDVSKWANGVYFLNIRKGEKHVETLKFIVL